MLRQMLPLALGALPFVLGAPTQIPQGLNVSDPSVGPVPGFSDIYNTYQGKAPPFPLNQTAPVPATASGPPGADDLLFQNLLQAEWVITNFYQTAVEMFTAQDFINAGYSDTTYSAIAAIRDNEAGHLRIFQDSISPTSLKPGACNYAFGFTTPLEFLALQVLIELVSCAFVSGLAVEARLNATKTALVVIGEVEARHNSWSLLDVWKTNPFVGPADTAFPYADQILDITNQFVVSCPSVNPPSPSPNQHLPKMNYNSLTSNGVPGDNLTVNFTGSEPSFSNGTDYYMVFFHGVENATMPFDTTTNSTQIPWFDNQGIILAVIADTPGAPTQDSVLAGPLVLLEQPATLTTAISQ